jgi:NTE family protein
MALGGFLRLTGAPPDSLYGSKVDFGRAVAAREVGSLPLTLGGTVRLGLSLEVGRIAFEQQGLGSKTRAAGSVFAVADTRFGPVFLAWGNTPGIGSAAYLFLGSVLLPHPLLR